MEPKKHPPLAERCVRVLPAILLGGLALHFSLTLAFLTPLNPIKLRLLPLIDGYIQPFFNQRWSLFAPNLEAKTRYLLVSCRGEDAHGVSTERPWMNITLPLHELKQRYRLTPADRLERAQMVGANQLELEDDELSRKLLEKPADTAEYRAAVAFVEQQREGRKRAGMRLLRRVASRACAELYPELRPREVRVRMATIQAPLFSQRMDSEAPGDTRYAELPWQPYEELSAP
jgi:hypothetical protein